MDNYSGRGKPARGTPPLRRAPGSARSVHTAISGVHKLWTKLLIRCGGARGERQVSETDLAEVWARSLEELATMQIEPHQRAWLKLTRPLGLVENTALIATPNEFVKEQLETRLRALITHALSRELGRSIQLAVTVDPTAISAATAFPAPAPGGGMPAPGPVLDGQDEPRPAVPRQAGDPDASPGLAGNGALGRRARSAAARSTRWPTAGSTPVPSAPAHSTRARSRARCR